MHPKCKSTRHRSLVASHRSASHQSTSHRSASLQSTNYRSPGTGQFITGQPGTGQPVTVISLPVTGRLGITRHQSPGTRHLITRHQSRVNQSLVTGHHSTYQAPVIMWHSMSNDHLVSNISLGGSEQSFPNEPQNPTASKRVLLPLEPDFSQMSDPSVIIGPPSNTKSWQSADRHTSLSRHNRRDQPKTKHRTKKRKRHRLSSSSSSSRSSSLDSQRRNRRSKSSKHLHKKRRGHSMSSSSSSSSSHDYGRYCGSLDNTAT